ncbi:uncharacterized protein LOC134287184 [Aedes albopictus]|uniref:Peptidase A2 domain-containing protein n=1 Tax=Aedes albopictus TaxID=7160 RepID=A0ABM1YCZ6_AEDAL
MEYPCMMISAKQRFSEPCLVSAFVEKVHLKMEIDCGAAVSVISLTTYKKHFVHIRAHNCSSRLVVVNGQQLSIYGKIEVDVTANSIQHRVSLIILDGQINFVPLLGRNWLDIFYPNWRDNFGSNLKVNNLNENQQIPALGYEADLVLKEERPVFRKAYEVPFKLKDKVIEHLDSLEKQNVITPIKEYMQSSSESITDNSTSTNKYYDTHTYPERQTTPQ